VVDEADFACDVCAVKSSGKPEHRPAASSKSPPTPAGNRCKLLLGAASSFVGSVGSSVGQRLARGRGRACIGLSEEVASWTPRLSLCCASPCLYFGPLVASVVVVWAACCGTALLVIRKDQVSVIGPAETCSCVTLSTGIAHARQLSAIPGYLGLSLT
jgi:hypothetical protein